MSGPCCYGLYGYTCVQSSEMRVRRVHACSLHCFFNIKPDLDSSFRIYL